MAKSDGAGKPAVPERSLLTLLRESGDVLEASSPSFDATAGAARLRAAAWSQGLLRPDDMADDDSAAIGAALAVTGATLEEQAPAFDVEAGAARLREAARARHLLSSAGKVISERPILHSRYRLLDRLGAGGAGSVWKAEDLQLQRIVALKELVRHAASEDPTRERDRALQEARAIARVRHPAIVSVHDVFFDDDDPWIVMDYISGRPLDALIEERQLDEREIAAIALQVARGLSAAHGAGVVHRDVKPANILIAEGAVTLVDFGIAQITGGVSVAGEQTLVGTVEFLAPERLLGNKAGPAADLWSLGVTLFRALEGYSPFVRGPEYESIIGAILHGEPPRPLRQGPLADVIVRLLAKDPAMRAGASELAEALQSIVAEAKPPTPERETPAQSAAAEPPPPTGVTLAGLSFEDAREIIQQLSPEGGAAMLLAMPHDQAWRTLGEISIAKPGTAGNILRVLDTADAHRMLAHLTPDKAAAALATMPTDDATRVLSRTSARRAASIITELPVKVTAALTMGMPAVRAAEILAYVQPITVAAILPQLNPAIRAQIIRFLPHQGRALPQRSQLPGSAISRNVGNPKHPKRPPGTAERSRRRHHPGATHSAETLRPT